MHVRPVNEMPQIEREENKAYWRHHVTTHGLKCPIDGGTLELFTVGAPTITGETPIATVVCGRCNHAPTFHWLSILHAGRHAVTSGQLAR